MKIIHRATFSCKLDKKCFRKFTKLGIEPWTCGPAEFSSVRFFDISEDDPRWPKVSEIIKKNKIPTLARAEFTKEEILSAEWVWISPVYFEDESFPEPHLDDSWKKMSFDYENECPDCGVGLRQKAPIRLKGEPNLKNNDFMSVFWAYPIFARPEVLNTLMENKIEGFEISPVINHSSNTALETVKQMRVIDELLPCIIPDNLQREHRRCTHIKYYGISHVMLTYPKANFINLPDLIRSGEWFGTGYAANQLILASAKFIKVYMENGWKGLSLAPIRLIQPCTNGKHEASKYYKALQIT